MRRCSSRITHLKNSLFYGLQMALTKALKTFRVNYRNPFLIEFGCWSYSTVLL